MKNTPFYLLGGKHITIEYNGHFTVESHARHNDHSTNND